MAPIPRPTVAVGRDEVVRTHPPGTDAGALRAVLAAAASEPWSRVLLSPLSAEPERLPDGSLRTRWPRLGLLDADAPPERLPWAEAGRHLAELHLLAVPPGLGPHGGRDRLARAAARAPGVSPLLAAVTRELLDAWPAPAASGLVHGDWHLGNLAWRGGRLVALDLDDLGVGDPAWDLGRPAGFWAAGLLDDRSLDALLSAYAGAGGPADTRWAALDFPARAAVAVAAVRAALHSEPTAAALSAACRRMAR